MQEILSKKILHSLKFYRHTMLGSEFPTDMTESHDPADQSATWYNVLNAKHVFTLTLKQVIHSNLITGNPF